MKGLRRSVAKYGAIAGTQLANTAAYPVDLAGRSVTIVMFLFIFLQLWRATYQSAGQTTLEGLSLHDTLWYLMLAESIQLSKPRVSGTIADAVRDGSVAYLLNKPYDFLLYQLSVGLGDSALRFATNVLAGGALVWLSVGAPPDPRGWPLVLIAVVLAFLLDFCLNAIIGLAAFVAEDVNAFNWIYQKFILVLGGLLIPLDFFPGWLGTVARALPFAYTMYGPSRLFVSPSLERFGGLVLMQAFWLAVVGAVLVLAYRRGLAQLTINGG